MEHDAQGFSRRGLIVAGAGTALAVTVVAGCSSSDGTTAADPGGSPNASPTTSTPKDGSLAQLADIPVGGAVSATGPDGKPVIVAQPTAGKVVAFSAICTHQGCTVAPQGSVIRCPCHGSTYDLATGDNTGGPAPSPLAAIPVTVRDGAVVEA